MNKLWLVFSGIVALILGVSVYIIVLLHAASQLYVSDFSITELREVSDKGISFTGELSITNPSSVDIMVNEIRYTIILENTDEEIARGKVYGGNIKSKETVTLTLHQETSWLPTMDALLRMTSEEKVYLLIQGQGDAMAGGIPLTGPVEDRVDVKPLVMQWLEKKKAELLKNNAGLLKMQRR